MITKNGKLKCDYCGQFMSYNSDFGTYNEYGGSTDSCPPDPKHIKKDIYLSLSEWQKDYLKNKVWIPIYFNESS